MGSTASNNDEETVLAGIREIILDCDGVIIDSISAKTDSFIDLMAPVTGEEEQEIRMFHARNPGMHRSSVFRYCRENILNRPVTDEEIQTLCDQFNRRVSAFMPELPLVEGLESFLDEFEDDYRFHVVSGAPQKELETILREQNISSYFDRISGSPPGKPERAESILDSSNESHRAFLLIGDAQEDLEMAHRIDAPMVFRPSTDEVTLDSPSILFQIDDFHDLSDRLRALH